VVKVARARDRLKLGVLHLTDAVTGQDCPELRRFRFGNALRV